MTQIPTLRASSFENKVKTLSVVLTTYNGERFLRQQLDSIAAQTQLPSQLLVSDDKSSDATVDILRQFAASAPFPVIINVNENTLGWRANFMHALGLCDTELFALCDQDDVWHPEKLAQAVPAFHDPEVVLFFHNAWLIDAKGDRIGPADIFPQPPVSEALSMNSFYSPYGFSMVCSRKLLVLSDIWKSSVDSMRPQERAPHDQWLFFLAMIFGTIIYSDARLCDYRQHGANVVGHVHGVRRRWKTLRDRMRNQYPSYETLAHAAAIRADILSKSEPLLSDTWRERAISGHERYTRLSHWLEQRATLYRSPGLLRRLGTFRALCRGEAYQGRSGWELGQSSMIKDGVLGVLLRSLLTTGRAR